MCRIRNRLSCRRRNWALRLARDWAPCSARDDMHVGDCWRIVGEDWHVGCSVRPQEALDLSEGIHGGSVVTGQGGGNALPVVICFDSIRVLISLSGCSSFRWHLKYVSYTKQVKISHNAKSTSICTLSNTHYYISKSQSDSTGFVTSAGGSCTTGSPSDSHAITCF